MYKLTVGQRVQMTSRDNDGVPYGVQGTVVAVTPFDIGVSWDKMRGSQTGHDCRIPGVVRGWWVDRKDTMLVPQEPEDDLYV